MNGNRIPHIAIVDPNALAAIGLRQLLQQVIPIMQVDAFRSLDELEARGDADAFVHYFVAQSIVVAHMPFFQQRRTKTIVITLSRDPKTRLSGFHSLCVDTTEEALVKHLLLMEQHAHAHGRNLPPMPPPLRAKVLSDREIQVLSLIVQGHINKEIADQLNIGLTTVITHRKNIMEKLGLRSVSALTIYAVMHGYVDISKI